MSSTPAKDTPLHLPYNVAFSGWWKRELPYRLQRAHRKLRCMFGSTGTDTAEYLELIMDGLEQVFALSDRLIGLVDRPDPIPVDIDGVTIHKAIKPSQVRTTLRGSSWFGAEFAYRTVMKQHATQAQLQLKFDFVEHTLAPILYDIALPRMRDVYVEQTNPIVCAMASRIVSEQLLFDCWFMLYGVHHPLSFISQSLRSQGALPILFNPHNAVIILVAKPPEAS